MELIEVERLVEDSPSPDSSDDSSIESLSSITDLNVRIKPPLFSKSTLVRISDFSTVPFWKKVGYLLIISISSVVSINCLSFYYPFYPNYAEDQKGISTAIIGDQTGLLNFLIFIFCIAFGIFINIIGPKFMYFSGYLTLSVSMLLFGFIDRMNSSWFVIYSFILVVILSISLAAIFTSSYSIGMSLFPNHQNTVLAIIDTIGGIGYIIGPIIGGILYERTGWFWSFAVNAVLAFICTICSLIFLPFIKIGRLQSQSFKDYLNIFRLIPNLSILSIVAVNLVVTMCWSYQYNSIGPFLERTYSASFETIGYILAMPNISYTLLLPFIGIISERRGARFFIWLSLPVQMLALVLTPPLYYIFQDRSHVTRSSVNISILPLPENRFSTNYIAVTFIGQFLLGVGYTLAYGAMYVDMERNVSEKLKRKLGNLPEILSSVRIGSYSFANGMGPIISGFLEPVLSFDDQTLIFIFILIATFIYFTPLSIWSVIYPKIQKRKFCKLF